jgi:hypothetical protein
MNPSGDLPKLSSLSREQLYELVWTEAMATLAPKLGISDVGLKKRCLNLGIPTPSRGYWAKLQNGKKVKKEALPATWTVRKKRKRLPKSADDLRKYTAPERDYSREKLLPIVSATRKALLKQKPNFEYGLCDVWQEGVLRTKVSPSSIDRAVCLWSELIEACKQLDLSLVKGAGTAFTDGKQTVKIELKEKTGKYLADKPKVRDDPFTRIRLSEQTGPTPEHSPTGFLQFRAEDACDAPCAKKWADSATAPLDTKILEIAACLLKLIQRKAQREIEMKEAAIRRREEELQRCQEQERQKHAQGRVRRLIRQAASLSKANEIRSLVDRVGSESPESAAFAMKEWLAWAKAVADSVDPTSQIVQRLAVDSDPSEPEYQDLYPDRRY